MVRLVMFQHNKLSQWKRPYNIPYTEMYRRDGELLKQPIEMRINVCILCLKDYKRATNKITKHPNMCNHCAGSNYKGLPLTITHPRLKRIYTGMLSRVKSKDAHKYKYYRGITVCPQWLTDFNAFKYWSLLNGYTRNLTIDRIDNSKGYFPDTCRWASKNIQARNTRKLMETNTTGYRGVSKRISKVHKHITYYAKVRVNTKDVFIKGNMGTALEAALAYDTYVKENNLEHTTNGLL